MHDVAIIGSGFSGSILGWILASQGMNVALIDSQTHPRFAIGESSTPLADMLLRQLGQQYEIQPLVDLATYGGWKANHPQLTCGKKQGFSYFHHHAQEHFTETSVGERSLLVAASRSNELADTHWYRSEVDEYFFKQAILSGVMPHSATSVENLSSVGNQYRLQCRRHTDCSQADRSQSKTIEIFADHIIDASGRAAVTARLLEKPNLRATLKTQTSAVFGHFQKVQPWTQYLKSQGCDTLSDPFDADDAAQHHLGPFGQDSHGEDADGQVTGGWTWMLRFDNDITSVGFCAPRNERNVFAETPPCQWMMKNATQVHPAHGNALHRLDWIQSYFHPIVAPRIWMMPTAAITLDPLHSTGIAHALAGVDRLAKMLLAPDLASPSIYADTLHQEVALLDELTSTAYSVMSTPDRFHAACMVYFAGAIRCEERLQASQTPTHLYSADDADFIQAAKQACQAIRNPATTDFAGIVRDQIAPWNTANLMAPAIKNRYAYTATKA